MENIFGLMAGVIKVNGEMEKCMEREFTNGQTEKSMKGTTKTTKNMGLAYMNGRRAKNTKENGTKEANTEKGSLQIQKASQNGAIGNKDRENTGLKISDTKSIHIFINYYYYI